MIKYIKINNYNKRENIIKKQKEKKVFKFTSYLKRYKRLIFWGPVFKALEASTEVITPFLMAIIIDDYIKTANTNGIIWLTVIILAINILGMLFAILGQKFASVSSESIGKDIRNDIFSHINTFSHAELDRFSTTTLLNRTIFDVYHLQEGFSMIIRMVLRIPFILIGSIVMSVLIDFKLSLIFLIVIPLLIFVIFEIMRKISPLLTQSKLRVDNTSNVTRENLSGVRVVRAFNKQDYEIKRFSKTNEDLLSINIKEGLWSALLIPAIYLIVNSAIIMLIYVGAIQINTGTDMTQGNLIAFINYFAQISMSLVSAARLVTMFTRMKTSEDRINEVMFVNNSITNPSHPVKIDKETFDASVEFNDVCFSYNGLNNVISNLSLTAKSGQTIGIIGGTGSGKSSITNLIPRFYDVTSGCIKVNNVDVKKYNVEELRNIVSIVPQNPILFEGTIRTNMRWRKEDATDEEIIFALKIAQAYDFVSEYPDFLDHKVNRGGTNFSGGQKQRLTIARALVGSPKILILDDSSSALDFATDAKLRNAINKYMKGITTFIVSQRTNAIKNADSIVVLEAGRVVCIGTHEMLLENCDIYKEIHLSQNKKGVKV